MYVRGFGMWEEGGLVATEVENHLPLDEAFSSYLLGEDPFYADRVEEIAAGLGNHATEAFMEATEAEVAAGMLVSHQEWRGIRTALGQYAVQEEMPNGRIAAYHNWPADVSKHDRTRTRGELDRFIEKNPQVPFAYFEGEETEELRMGRIRKLVTDVVLCATVWDTPGDIMLTSHDADMTYLDPLHFTTLHGAFTNRGDWPYVTVTPFVGHTESPNVPNMNRVISWNDEPGKEMITARFYEPGPAWSARAYMHGGYDRDRNFGETHYMLNSIHQGDAMNHPARIHVPQARMLLSPRREYHKLSQMTGDASVQIWTGQDGDLVAKEEYRRYRGSEFAYLVDITDEQRDTQLRSVALNMLTDAAVHQGYLHLNEPPSRLLERALVLLERQRAQLGGPEDMFTRCLDTARSILNDHLTG
jgi:hypothetical protein